MGLFKGRDTDGGAKTQIFLGGSKTIMGFAHQATRRSRLVLAAMGVGAVVVAATAVGVVKFLDADAAARVVQSYSAMTTCLLGELPADNARASLRFRSIQLTALTQNEIRRATDKDGPWPDRCGKYAHALHEALSDSSIGETKGKSLLEASRRLAEALDKKESFWEDFSTPIDRTFDEALKTGIRFEPSPMTPAPPAPSTVLTLDGIGKAGVLTDRAIALADLRTESLTGAVVRFVVDDAKGGVRKVCSVTQNAARCDAFPKALDAAKGSVRLDGSTDDGAEPLLFVGDVAYTSTGVNPAASSAGSFAATANPEPRVLGGHAARDGQATLLVEGTMEPSLVRIESGKTQRQPLGLGALKLADARRDVRLLWDDIVALATDGKGLVLASRSAVGGGTARLEPLGALPKASPLDRGPSREPRIDGCRVRELTVARAHTGREEFLSFKSAGKWSVPLKTAAFGGALHCQQGAALMTLLEGGAGDASLDAKLVLQRCSATECRIQAVPLREVFAGEVNLASPTAIGVGAIDGKVVVVWQAKQRGGLRVRIAEFSAIATAPDLVVYDDLIQDGALVANSTLLDMKLVSAESFAVLLLATPGGLRALRLSSNGDVTQVAL